MTQGRPWGSEPPHPPPPPLESWEIKVINAVGDVIAFWGFKHNHGRIWTLLYLRERPLSAAEIQESLGLSKGAVSMLLRDLEGWDIVSRSLDPQTGTRQYVPNVELTQMIIQTIQRREAGLIVRSREMLQAAEREALSSPKASPRIVERIRKLRQLAEVMDQALQTIIKTTTLDVGNFVDVLRAALRRRVRGER
ncbi:MAG: MarR family transcriptional regulator [Myxococcota bacterium]